MEINNIFFTSDIHFGHKSILNFSPCFRKFNSVDEMDKRLVKLWNDTVKPNDEIYNLGDLVFYKDIEKSISTLKKLNGKHTLILGNHDKIIENNKDELLKITKNDGNKLFEEIVHYKELCIKSEHETYRLVLFHYPMVEWNRGHYDSILLYGHIHDNLANIKGKALNVGYDLHGRILHLRDVISFVKDLEPFLHHGKKDFPIDDDIVSREFKIKDKLRENNE